MSQVVKNLVIWVGCLLLLTAGHRGFLYGHGAPEGTISPERLKKDLNEIKLLDVRPEKEYKKEHIDEALMIPLEDLSQSRLSNLGLQENDKIVVYAKSNMAAEKAKLLLDVMGFTDVRILAGGLVHWKEDGFPTVSGEMDTLMQKEERKEMSSIRIKPSEYDFGIVPKQGGVVRTTFSLLNTGDERVAIQEINTSCGCTSAEVYKKVIQPAETVPLEVRFDPDFHQEPSGRFSRTVFLQTSEGHELEVKIYVQIKE